MTARIHIDLNALVQNYRLLGRAAAPGRCAAVVKADAYGLGVDRVAPKLWDAGCRDFFVASAAEALALRGLLATARIFVFEGARPESLAALRDGGLIPVLNHADQLESWRRFAPDRPLAVHIDSGMHRLGFAPELPAAALSGLNPVLLLTHLACADDPAHPLNAQQLACFAAVRERLPALPVSIGNSAGVLSGRGGDLGRPGIALYGGNPFAGQPNPTVPVVTLEGQILQVRAVAAGETVGYGATFTAPRAMRVAVVGLGYADGLPRLLSNRGFAMHGARRCPIVGRVSMDLTSLDVSDCAAGPGDWLEFLGPRVPVDAVAGWAETIAYEILTGLGRRPARSYSG